MIQRYQTPTRLKIGNAFGSAFMHAMLLGLLAAAVIDRHVVAILILGGIEICLSYMTYMQFIRARLCEVYLLSSRTLAIVHPRRSTRFIKPADLVIYRRQSQDFKLEDGSKIRCWTPKRELEFAENLITRWYGEATLAAQGKSRTIDLANAKPRPVPTVQRFPQERPRWRAHVASFAVLLVFYALFFVPAIASVTAYIPAVTDAVLFFTICTTLSLGPMLAYFAVRCYTLFYRGIFYTTVLLSNRTLAVVRPGRATRFIKRDECVAYRPTFAPTWKNFILDDGTCIGFGIAESLSDPPQPTAVIWRRWWPYVPEDKRMPSLAPFFLTMTPLGIGLFIAMIGGINESTDSIIIGMSILISAIGYGLYRSLLSDGATPIPLKPEHYTNTTRRRDNTARDPEIP